MSRSDFIQLLGAVFILTGYWIMARNIKWASAALTIGCAIWAYWALVISPIAWWLFGLELTLGAMSARTFWINRRAAL